MRVLVTGATGYLGSHLVPELVRCGHEVTVLVRSPARLGDGAGQAQVTVVQADLEDRARVRSALVGQEAVVHAALIWGDLGDELELRDTAATARLFDAAGREGVRRAIYVSSTAVHRPFVDRMDEHQRITTSDVYGATKAAGELFLWAACAAHGMEGHVVRPGPIVGPPRFPGGPFRSPDALVRFARAAIHDEPIHVRRSDGRQFVAAPDVARVLAGFLTTPRSGDTWLCVDPVPTRWEDLARRVVQVAGSRSRVVLEGEDMKVPTFDTRKLREQLGLVLDSRPAMGAHVDHLVRLERERIGHG